jgi:hypothetical protein
VENIRGYRIGSQLLDADRMAVTALQRLRDYEPLNVAYKVAALVALKEALVQAEQNELYAQNALEAARDAKAAAEWALHDGVLGAKAQVLAQYGPNSDAIQSLGLKKKSKYRRATSRPAKGT